MASKISEKCSRHIIFVLSRHVHRLMCFEGYCGLCVCVSISQHLNSQMFSGLEKRYHIYSARSAEDQTVPGVIWGKQLYPIAVEALQARLHPGSKTGAAQEFRHSLQRSGKSVSDFIWCIVKKYQMAYV